MRSPVFEFCMNQFASSGNESAYQHSPLGFVVLAVKQLSLLKVSSGGGSVLVLRDVCVCVCAAASAILGTLLMRGAQA